MLPSIGPSSFLNANSLAVWVKILSKERAETLGKESAI
jgi:hypothetical protein